MQNKITQAAILSAGFGTRLRPITDNIPKVMVPILGKPLLEWHMEQFKKHGVKEIFINLHYLPEVIKNYFGNGSRWGVEIIYRFEEKILGTAGGVKDFEEHLKENFFVIYGDIFSLVNYSEMSESFFRKENPIGMELVGDTDHPNDSDLVAVDKNLRFAKLYPKPHDSIPEKYKSMRGVYILNRGVLKFIPRGAYYEIDHNLLPELLQKNFNFYGYECGDYLKDVGTMERYDTVQKYLKRR